MDFRRTGRTTTALLVLLLGALLLAGTTGAFATESLWNWVPGVFVLLGAWALLRSRGRNLTGPVMVIAVAGTVQLRNLGVISDAQIGSWWPLFVVLFGLLLLVGRGRRRSRVEGTSGELDAIAVFGGADTRVTATDFTGGDVISIFGGSEIDLRDAEISDPPAVIEAVTLFGGTEFRVPPEWNVTLDVLAIFGGTEDSRRRETVTETPDLVVTGVTLFGGVEILD
ncbi:hypothetical protein HTSR_1427 [Halodesulfurarchaeum formicicum]|uniref:LiaF transmembrane domain-containing protein n=1 Tax=Halodesulfurarchaeum formicicum TaxID=1873524 RepID=A0A1D8S5H6_9EURY|nr:DUF5668 domain-containing protein [Halodesulfurarchaeum formicicum]AOW80603.1 hypothetical protein HTSR_1427 [Halodesulfurarchaeum formicicum]